MASPKRQRGLRELNAVQPIAANSPPLDDRGFIAAHAPCVKCDYELLGLKPDGVCPECGTPVASSTSGPLLRCVPPDQFLRLRIGLPLALLGFLLLALGPVIALAPGFLFGARGIAEAGLIVTFPIANVLLTCAVLLTMSFHPANTNLGDRPERLLSATAAIGMLVLMLIVLVMLFSGSLRHGGGWSFLPIGFYALLFGASGACFCRYTGRILACCNRPAAGRIGSFLAIFLGLSCSVVTLSAILGMAQDNPTAFDWEFIFLMMGQFVGFLCIIGILVFLPLVLRAVSAEFKIAQAWANTAPVHPLGGERDAVQPQA